MSLLDIFWDQARRQPRQLAIIEGGGERITYGDLQVRVGYLAAALVENGITKGDRVLVAIWPGIDLYVTLAGLWSIGAVAVFPEAATGLAGLRHAATAAQPVAIICGSMVGALRMMFTETRSIGSRISPSARGRRALEPMPLDKTAPALISFTSGSTGTPKGIVRSHGLLYAQHMALSAVMAPEAPHQTDLVAFPAFVLSCLGHGTTAVLPVWNMRRHDRADGDVIAKQINRMQVTRAFLPPSCVQTLSRKAMPTVLRRVLTGGGPLYPDVARRLLTTSNGLGLTVLYGSTEAEPISHIDMDTMPEADWSTATASGGLPVGHPVSEASIRLVDNEVQVAGPHVVEGYMDPARDSECKVREGSLIWHRTGDAARFDAQGRLWLLGRVASAVSGCFPFAVESAARTWTGVNAAAMAAQDGKAILFIEGSRQHQATWNRMACDLGVSEVVCVPSIPMDTRHRSKPDVRALLARSRRR